MKKELSEVINLQSFITSYDHIMACGWNIEEVRQKVLKNIEEAKQALKHDPGNGKCPACEAPLIVKTETREVISFCSICDYEGK